MKTARFFILFLSILSLLLITSASALDANFTNRTAEVYIERVSSNLFNVTVGAMSENITQVEIFITGFGFQGGYESFIANSNGTSNSTGIVFTNYTNYSMPGGSSIMRATWTNTSSGGIMPNETTRSFWLNFNARGMVFGSTPTIIVNTTGVSGTTNSTSYAYEFSFRFSGEVQDEDGNCKNGTNVSFYSVLENQGGPPTESVVSSVLSTGCNFTISGLNATMGNTMYKVKLVYYNSTNGLAEKIGPTIMQMPVMMYFPMAYDPNMPVWMMPPNLNGSRFTLQPALTLNLSAYSTSVDTFQRFGYEVMDLTSGMPIAASIFSNVTSTLVVVPSGRTYNVMIVRAPFNGVSGFQFSGDCTGSFFNDTHCPTPPKSNSTAVTSSSSAGSNINVSLNVSVVNRYFYGCINYTSANVTVKNITQIATKMVPYPGFIPPMNAGDNINMTDPAQLNYSDARCPGMLAWFNLTLINSIYQIEFYARNLSNNYSIGEFYNISLESAQTRVNLTLKPFLGRWDNVSSGTAAVGFINTTKIKVNILNSSGTIYSNFNGHIELIASRPSTGKVRYVIETSNATFFISLLNDTTSAKLNVFPNGPPMEKRLNLSAPEINITISDGQGFGFKKVNSSGGFEDMNVSNIPVEIRFIRNSAACNIINPPASCVISNMSAENYCPFKAMTAGKVNLEMRLTNKNVTLMFINFDMFAAKPPTNSMFNENGKSTGTADIWKFGSFAPKDAYDEVIIGMPYNTTIINDSHTMNMQIPLLYDEDSRLVFNSSRGDTYTNLTSEYTEKTQISNSSNSYNFNSTGFKDFLTTTGVTCSKTDSNISNFYCYVNTSSDMLYIRVPHFSTVSPQISAVAPVTSTSSSSSSGGSYTAPTSLVTETYTNVFAKITAGVPVIVTPTASLTSSTGLKEVIIISNVDKTNVGVDVSSVTESSIANKTTDVYKYFTITADALPESLLSKAEIKFEIAKSWFTDNNYDSTKVTLLRYKDGAWQKLTTVYEGESTSSYVYRGITPGFSMFAITAEKKAVESAPTDTTGDQTSDLGQTEKSKMAYWIGLIVLALVLAGIVYYLSIPKGHDRFLPYKQHLKRHKEQPSKEFLF